MEQTDRPAQEQSGLWLRCGETEAQVCPARGMTVEHIRFRDTSLIECDERRRAAGATYAVPVLYPTPNRVRGNCFTFEGVRAPAQMHGAARGAAFRLLPVRPGEDGAACAAALDFLPGTKAYEAFPWPSRLTVRVSVAPRAVRWDYAVQNLGDRALPYGFALHPFFNTLGGARYCVNAAAHMEMDADKLPTGALAPARGARCGVGALRDTGAAELDDVFCVQPDPMARIEYPAEHLALTLRASAEFGRCVVYTPRGQGWFCIEPQTSSTDCHNLYARGFAEAANLQIVPPHAEKAGFAELIFSPMNL